jgi:hypothetical protein
MHRLNARVMMRALTVEALLLTLVLMGGCQPDSTQDEDMVGCGILTPQLARDAVGRSADSRRTHHGCRLTDPADSRNHLTIVTGQAIDAESFMQRRCSGGWVYAGTPEKFLPACITRTARFQTTVMVSDWDGLKVQVELGRDPDSMSDDAEKILDISRDVAAHIRTAG